MLDNQADTLGTRLGAGMTVMENNLTAWIQMERLVRTGDDKVMAGRWSTDSTSWSSGLPWRIQRLCRRDEVPAAPAAQRRHVHQALSL